MLRTLIIGSVTRRRCPPPRRPPLELLFVELHEEAPVARSVSDLGATIRHGSRLGVKGVRDDDESEVVGLKG